MGELPEIPIDKIQRVLRTVDLFDMLSDADLARVAAAGKVLRLGPGEVLFHSGEPPNSIHVVLDGAVEILRSTPEHRHASPVAYLTPGEAVGDMAILTGSPRRSTARAPERADVWTLDRPSFEFLIAEIHDYGLQLATVFAARLERFIISHLRGQTRRRELAGKLRYFDLPTVVQTLVSSSQTGILTLIGENGKPYAEVLLRDGAIERARCGVLEGEEAFYQLFFGSNSGEFTFRSVADPNADAISRVVIELSAVNLLMESIRRVDEFPSVRNRLPDPEKPYQACSERLEWEDNRTLRIAMEIHAWLLEPRRLSDLIGEVPCSTYTLYQMAAELYKANQIA